ncbi:MAG TPA: hypothetical protein VHW24_01555 [Bryobacteraceae bacterium]|nr:hypothetical protein [Bryobacteraceae bacterium]
MIGAETHQRIFTWVLELLAQGGLIKGKTIGVDSTTLEANAAMKSIVRRDRGENYNEGSPCATHHFNKLRGQLALACHKAGDGFALRVQTQAARALPVGGNPVIRHKLPARIAPGVQIPTISRRCCSGR